MKNKEMNKYKWINKWNSEKRMKKWELKENF